MINPASGHSVFSTIVLGNNSTDPASPRTSTPPLVQMFWGEINTIDLAPFIFDADGDSFTCAKNFAGAGTVETSPGADLFSVSPDCKMTWDPTSVSWPQKLATPIQIVSSTGVSVPLDVIVEVVA